MKIQCEIIVKGRGELIITDVDEGHVFGDCTSMTKAMK